ncbi:MAG: hypothetical protein WC314_01005 [Vulcanimicrobiota bacterium]
MKLSVLSFLLALLLSPVAQAQEEGSILQGQTSAFQDPTNHFSVMVPVEFKQPIPGSPVLTFEGPLFRGGALSYHINTVNIPSVPSDTMYGISIEQTRKDPFYTEVKEVKISGGRGYLFKEITTERDGSAKSPESIHRWHLAAFGGGRYYNCTFGGTLSSFDDPVVIQAFEEIVRSFTIQ